MLLSTCPLKERPEGRKVVNLPIIIYSDDTSGNQSKNLHACEMDSSLTINVQVSVHRAVRTDDDSLINCGSSLAYYATIGKVSLTVVLKNTHRLSMATYSR